MYKRNSGKKGPVTSKKVVCDGVEFKSGLEKNMHLALKDEGVEHTYEGKTFMLHNKFFFPNICYERQANGKGEFMDRGNGNINDIKYTPDFVGDGFIIECKGRPNDAFPIRWKLFKKHMADLHSSIMIFKPQCKDECIRTAQIIKQIQKLKEKK